MEQIEANGIQIYPLPDCDDDEDEEYKEQCRQLKVTKHISLRVQFMTVQFARCLFWHWLQGWQVYPIAENEVDP